MDRKFCLEVCVDSYRSAKAALDGGADRLELCSNLIIGGTTPSYALFLQVKNLVSRYSGKKLHVLSRPRFGDFCYNEKELEEMKKEIAFFRNEGADGIVVGVLSPDGSLDMDAMKELTGEAGACSITLHRAFDVAKNPADTLEKTISLGINTILTSGRKNTCMDGMECLRELIEQADHRLDIMVGSGVKAEHIQTLYRMTGAHSYHMSGKKDKDSRMEYRNSEVFMGINAISEYNLWETDEKEIRAAKDILLRLQKNEHEKSG